MSRDKFGSFLRVWRIEEHRVKTSLTSLCRRPQRSQVDIHERDYSQVWKINNANLKQFIKRSKVSTDLVLPSNPPGLKNSGLRRRETTTAPPRPTLCTSPYLPRLSAVSKRPGACIGPAPGKMLDSYIISKWDHLTVSQLHLSERRVIKSEGQRH